MSDKMNLVDMKLPKKTEKELKSECMPVCGNSEQDRWPYGLQLRFEKDEMTKLPILSTLKVGDRVMVMAEARVTEVSSRETQNGGDRKTSELQIEKITIDPVGKKKPENMDMKEYRSMRENKK